jgi:hypothetical protein
LKFIKKEGDKMKTSLLVASFLLVAGVVPADGSNTVSSCSGCGTHNEAGLVDKIKHLLDDHTAKIDEKIERLEQSQVYQQPMMIQQPAVVPAYPQQQFGLYFEYRGGEVYRSDRVFSERVHASPYWNGYVPRYEPPSWGNAVYAPGTTDYSNWGAGSSYNYHYKYKYNSGGSHGHGKNKCFK